MICGTKADIEKLIPYVSDELAAALRYIAKTDFSKLADGEYPIDGDKVFARLSHYTTEPKEAKKPESHNQYIDVQYLAEGTEKIYYTAKDADKKVIEDYAADKDLLFYADAGEKDAVTLGSGVFAVFFPWELHRPGCHAVHGGCAVQKIVVKVLAK
ncbi:MAG: YhcH/YjgK/YiaL family protein [Succiniclasticum sp.]|jgi:biofilm protein TabA|nr:YhcH/YjgK/YiaL family protein [Succiniclasticum sp.]MEE3479895.1 YhcH/YjgK/YiaL family protein [Succiniclasticum sp.]